LVVADKVPGLTEGVALAAQALESGRARACLDRLVAITNQESIN
jgi:anthranilate phosphoribosyltransferase